MIQKIFRENNTTKLSGRFVVEQLTPFVGAPQIAEAYIMEMINAGTLIQDGNNLILSIETPAPQSTSEPTVDNQEIKETWYKLRQMEKKNVLTTTFKNVCEEFNKKFGWNYYILNPELRNKCEALGYVSVHPSERALFNKEVLQK